MRRLTVALALAAAPALPAAAHAEPTAEATAEAAAEKLELDFAVPSGPAFAFLGTSPTQILQPGSLKDLGIDLANGFDKDGRLKAGLAIAAQPASLIPALRRLRGLELSLGTARVAAAGNDLADRAGTTEAAIGARWTIIDGGDPWKSRAFRRGVATKLLGDCGAHIPPPAAGPLTSAEAAARNQPFRDCSARVLREQHAEFEDAFWNAFRLELGAAAGWRLPGSNPLDRESFYLGHSAWALLSGAVPGPIRKHSLWTAVAQLDQRHELEGAAYTEELKGGARLFLGNNRVHGYGELIFKYRWVPDAMTGRDDRDWDWTLGAEVRLRDKQWLVVGLGNALDDDTSVQVLGSVKWAITDQAQFARPE